MRKIMTGRAAGCTKKKETLGLHFAALWETTDWQMATSLVSQLLSISHRGILRTWESSQEHDLHFGISVTTEILL